MAGAAFASERMRRTVRHGGGLSGNRAVPVVARDRGRNVDARAAARLRELTAPLPAGPDFDVDVVEELAAPCAPEVLFGLIAELDRYPAWLDIVQRAEPLGLAAGADTPAWEVDLRGRLGPLARSKRLRMVRTRHDPPRGVTFERRELDGRAHSPWVLRADVSPAGDRALLTMRLHYGGGFWGPMLERMLGDEIARSRPRLLAQIPTA